VKFSSASRNAQHIPGLDTVVYTTNVSDTTESIIVHCAKHDKWIDVDISLDDGLSRRDKLLQALKKCNGCLEIEAAKNTRFPEGAEL